MTALPFEFAAETDAAELARLRAARDYDTVFVDCPGSLEGHDVLSTVLGAADLVVIPCVPERAAITPTLRTAELVARAGVPYRVVLNQVDPLRGAGPVEAMWGLLDGRQVPRMHTFVRRYVAHSQSQLDGLMITQYRADRSWRAALDDMRRLARRAAPRARRHGPGPVMTSRRRTLADVTADVGPLPDIIPTRPPGPDAPADAQRRAAHRLNARARPGAAVPAAGGAADRAPATDGPPPVNWSRQPASRSPGKP